VEYPRKIKINKKSIEIKKKIKKKNTNSYSNISITKIYLLDPSLLLITYYKKKKYAINKI
jgi:hypothetical protein